MRYTLLFTIFLSLFGLNVYAVKARPDVLHEILQPDGSVIKAYRCGDEFFHYYINEEDKPLLLDAAGFLKKTTFETVLNLRSQSPKLLKKAESDEKRLASSNPSSGLGLFGELFPAIGSPHALIILVEYADVKFKVENPTDYFTRFLNEEGFNDDKGCGSAKDYFSSASFGQFTPTFDVYGPITLGNRAIYGANNWYGDDKNAVGMVMEACVGLDDKINFADYDTDNDGYVDNVYIIYAGDGEASYGPAESIWPHQWQIELEGKTLALDGVRINNYGCCNEWEGKSPAGIGTFCHEFGHVLGLPDLYSYSGSRATPGMWDIMDEGSYNNDGRMPPSYSAFERNAFGWIDMPVLKEGVNVTLPNIAENNTAFILPTDNVNEFFLFENRQKVGWDSSLPSHGMLVWHINYNKRVWQSNSVNEVTNQQYVDIEEANGKADNRSLSAMRGYAFPGSSLNTYISDTTTPNLLTWDKNTTGVSIYNIKENDDIISFSTCSSTDNLPVVTVEDEKIDAVYNLQGMRINPSDVVPGIYLVRSGETVKKMIVR